MQVAEAEGLAAVSMSRVAAELGAAPMSLYRYVSAKNELIALMVDTVYREFLVPAAADEGWRAGLSALAWAMRTVMYAHPWVLRVPISGLPVRPNEVAWFEQALSCLRDTGLAEAEKASVILLVSGYVRNEASTNADIEAAIRASGAAPSEWMSAYGRLLTKLTDPERFPALTQFIASGVFEQFDPPDREFIFGMERILDGIGDLVAARSAAPADPREPGGPPEAESTDRLALGAGGYGVLLGALGAGAIGGAFALPQARARLSANALVAAASLVYAAALAVVVLSRTLAFTFVVLLLAGVAWIAFLANVNAALQLFLPRWVRARGLAVYQMVLFGGQAAGALIWGAVAATAGLVPAFLISAAVMAGGAATIWFWPFYQVENMDRSLVRWPEPQLLISADRRDGLVLVRTTYTVADGKQQRFLQAMTELRRSRLRTGATDWALYQDGANPRVFIELFGVPSWEEHLRQHRERQTGTDLEYHDAAAALSDPPPQTDHYLAAAQE